MKPISLCIRCLFVGVVLTGVMPYLNFPETGRFPKRDRTLKSAIAWLDSIPPAQAQPITPAADGTDTVVTPEGNRLDIHGGTLSGDGANLFHSFEQFGLSPDQIANFISDPQIRNILGRVVGGDTSVINGLIQVTGGNSNLFLMNPAGIIFGVNAQLNVPAAFTATTATGIGFGSENWFNAFGENSYENLIGSPTSLAFDLDQSAAITNHGNLEVGEGQTLTLAGGSITNTGQLTAAGGQVAIAAVPGENLLRISQPGSPLTLEITPPRSTNGEPLPINPLDLPVLLTGNSGQLVNEGQVSTTDTNQGGSIHVVGSRVDNLGQIMADGANGGNIQVQTDHFLDTGQLSATGNQGNGGEIQVNSTGTVIQTVSATIRANGSQQGGVIEFKGNADTVLTTSGDIEATGEVGGTVHLFAETVQLLATDIDVSGNSGGGDILVGGDFQGQTSNAINAQNTIVNHSSRLNANALTTGNGGRAIVWSDQHTQFSGTIQAQGGVISGDGGFVEVSGKNTLSITGLVDVGAVNGLAGTLLLDPKNIIIDDSVGAIPQFDLVDPNADNGSGFGDAIVPLSTGNVAVTNPEDNLGGDNAGAVYLFNGSTGALLSILRGQTDDQVGSGGVTALSNGNYVVASPQWDNTVEGATNAGAVTWVDGDVGISGVVDATNSLIGTKPDDLVGDGNPFSGVEGITALANGNYVVVSPNWNGSAGAVTWGDGTTGITGEVNAANSLVGNVSGDFVGNSGVTALANGNYVVSSPFWNSAGTNNVGAVTWRDGTIPTVNENVNETNSLVGTQANDEIGSGGVTALTNGNYVVGSPDWDGNRGAVTWRDGTIPTGNQQVNETNSLVGTQANDEIGSGGVTALTNGNYVVSSPDWDGNRGAVTWRDGTIPTGNQQVDESNSLVGTQANDEIGSGGVTALTNGNYVVSSPNWDGNRGAVTWRDDTIPTGNQQVDESNSLVGTQANDQVGSNGVVELNNSNYVVISPNWNNNRGAVTWVDGSTGQAWDGTNSISDQNSITGRQSNSGLDTVVNDPVNQTFWVQFANEGNGRVTVGVPTALTFANVPGASVTFSPTFLQRTLNTGTAVVLQANNDITLDSPLDIDNPAGNGGDLTFQAGRSIMINADIFTDNGDLNLIANETLANGVVDSQRDMGNAKIVLANGIELDTGSGDINITLNTAEGLTHRQSGDITLAGNIKTNHLTVEHQRLNGGVIIEETAKISLTGDFQLNGANPLNFAGEVTTDNGSIKFNAPIILTDDTFLTTNGGNILLSNPIDGSNGTENLNITTKTGTVQLPESVGSITKIGNFTILSNHLDIPTTARIDLTGNFQLNGANPLNFAGEVTTANGSIEFNAPIILTDDTFLTTNGGDILLSNSINGSNGTESLNLIAETGTVKLPATVGNNTRIGNLTILSNSLDIPTTARIDLTGNFQLNGANPLNFAGEVTTANGTIEFNAPTLLNGDTFLRTNGGDIRFNNRLNGNGSSANLNLAAGIGNILFADSVGDINPLGNLTIFNANNLTANSSISVASLKHTTGTGTIDLQDVETSGGAVELATDNNLTTANITTDGGDIRLTSHQDAVNSGNLNSSAATGGDIVVEAEVSIDAGEINSSGNIGDGGDVTLDPRDYIQVNSINARGGSNGRGGNVEIESDRVFRATGSFPDNGRETSISTAGGNGGGDITIRHGGDGIIPFDVGDATTNGTAAAITSGEFTIAPFQSFPFTHTEGNIQIISVDETNDIPVNPVDLTTADSNQSQSPIEKDESGVMEIDNLFSRDYEEYFGLAKRAGITLEQAQEILRDNEAATGVKSAVIYVVFAPQTISAVPEGVEVTPNNTSLLRSLTPQPSDRLELILICADGQPIRRSVNVTRAEVLEMADQFRRTVTNVIDDQEYLPPAYQMYQWLIKPIAADLAAQDIKHLAFVMDTGLRSIPIAALYDGDQFIIENYSVGLMPSLSLTDTRYQDVRDDSVLAMGASKFRDKASLPGVPIELQVIADQVWQGESFLNEEFTLNNLKQARRKAAYGIVHLATHAEFQPGKPTNSYIQLWDNKLRLDQMWQLDWHKPTVELLVLSACRTALGDEEAELGFTGLAVQAGVKSALGSLWYVSDEGTLGLMSVFYELLKQSSTKAEALRKAQLAMLRGEVQREGDRLITTKSSIPLPPDFPASINQNYSHPYFWSSFTLIGNPW